MKWTLLKYCLPHLFQTFWFSLVKRQNYLVASSKLIYKILKYVCVRYKFYGIETFLWRNKVWNDEQELYFVQGIDTCVSSQKIQVWTSRCFISLLFFKRIQSVNICSFLIFCWYLTIRTWFWFNLWLSIRSMFLPQEAIITLRKR